MIDVSEVMDDEEKTDNSVLVKLRKVFPKNKVYKFSVNNNQ